MSHITILPSHCVRIAIFSAMFKMFVYIYRARTHTYTHHCLITQSPAGANPFVDESAQQLRPKQSYGGAGRPRSAAFSPPTGPCFVELAVVSMTGAYDTRWPHVVGQGQEKLALAGCFQPALLMRRWWPRAPCFSFVRWSR